MSKELTAEEETNQAVTSVAVFVANYNENLPDTFPQATVKNMHEFQATYPSLFKDTNDWSITKHRKKVMDWLVSHG